MRNCIAFSCIRVVKGAKKKQKRVLQVVRIDGKVLEFKHPLLVKDILANLSSTSTIGVGLSREADSVHLSLDYELKLGTIYYILPGHSASSESKEGGGGVTRIKLVITKQQLKLLLTKQMSLEKVIILEDRKRVSNDFPRNRWKPMLESIPEVNE
ncbi:hypothetical protein ACFE04_010259 [Oxalis oulophora]